MVSTWNLIFLALLGLSLVHLNSTFSTRQSKEHHHDRRHKLNYFGHGGDIESKRHGGGLGKRNFVKRRGGGLGKRIVGGKAIKEGEYPWAVNVQFINDGTCGASLIDRQWVITAAHCFRDHSPNGGLTINTNPHRIHIQAGSINVETSGEEEIEEVHYNDGNNLQKLLVEEVHVHPKYDPNELEWDVALMKLKHPLSLGRLSTVDAVLLPEDVEGTSWPKVGETCVLVGWGCTEKGGYVTNKASMALLDIWSNKDCDAAFKKSGINAGLNPDHEFCAGALGKHHGVCEGDSGSGLVCHNPDGDWQIAGVVSAGNPQAPGEFPGVFTRISYFSDWIYDTTDS